MAESTSTASPPPSPPKPADSPPTRWLAGIGMAMFLLGFVPWFGGDICSAWIFPGPNQVEFPLSEPRDVAVDSQGRIYVAVICFGRVQRYSPDGKFELGWDVPVIGLFSLRTTPEGHVLVAAGRKNTLLTYSADGELLKREENLPEDLSDSFQKETETTGHYAVHRDWWRPRVIDTHTGETVIETHWPLRLLAVPYPAFAYSWIGFLLGGIAGIIRWRATRGTGERAVLAPTS